MKRARPKEKNYGTLIMISAAVLLCALAVYIGISVFGGQADKAENIPPSDNAENAGNLTENAEMELGAEYLADIYSID